MAVLPLGRSAYDRQYGRMPEVELVNRIFEVNPTDRTQQVALLTRPVTKALFSAGQGPIRTVFSSPGAFGGDVFVVSGTGFFRYDGTTVTEISGTINGEGAVDICVVVGFDYEHMFLADGLILHLYQGTTYASGTLTLSPDTPPDIATQTLVIGTTYYQWTSSTPNPSGDGSSGTPFEVAVGADDEESLANMVAALNGTGTPGTTYSASITNRNTQVGAVSDATTMTVTARDRGTAGNLIATTVTGDHLAWGAATLSGGGVDALSAVEMPDGQAAVSCASIAGYVVVVAGSSDRWYFIEPAAIVIDALNFYTNEREPDDTLAVRQVGDYLLFFGQKSLETWYPTGNSTGDAFLPVGGQAYSIGALPGTIVKIRDFVMFVGSDNIPYIMSGTPKPIINHGMSEKIRVARRYEEENS